MKLLAFILLSSLVLVSCSKSNTEESQDVWIRLENKTTVALEDMKVGEVPYGNLVVDGITEYKIITQPLYAPTCQFSKNGDPINIAVWLCGTPPLPPTIQPGYYTFTIEINTSGYPIITFTKQ
jgi:hypothetical protein